MPHMCSNTICKDEERDTHFEKRGSWAEDTPLKPPTPAISLTRKFGNDRV